MEQLASGLDDRHAVLLTALDWQVQNGLNYFSQYVRPDVAYAHAADVLPYLPRFINDNETISRDIVATEGASRMIVDALGPAVSVARLSPGAPIITAAIERVPMGTRYVMTVLKSGRDVSIDWTDLGSALVALGDGRPVTVPDGDYRVIAGVRGRAPALLFGSNDPFDRRIVLDGVDTEIRMDAWLAADTIRRMGYGHVVASHQHSLIVERGVSFVALDAEGRGSSTVYAADIFAPQMRYLIKLRQSTS
jgi:hypothetical protein